MARLYWLLAALGGAGVLYWLTRSERGQASAADVLEEVIVSAKKIGEAAVDLVQPVGIRNNNPGNIRWDGTQWQGLANPMYDAGRYLRFVDPLAGLRALGKDLRSKYGRGLRTVRAIISVYAPPSENKTEAYVNHVASRLQVGTDEPLDVPGRLIEFMRAVVAHECGSIWENYYSPADYAEGARRALS